MSKKIVLTLAITLITFGLPTALKADDSLITTNTNESYYVPEAAIQSLPAQVGTGITDASQHISLPFGEPLEMTPTAESILASDDRIKVKNTTVFPYSATVFVQSTFPNGDVYVGSGSLVSSDGVLTAGHMIYNKARGGWATKVVIYPGLNGTVAPFGSATAIKLFSVDDWTNNQDTQHDIGMMRLDKPIGYQTGWFGMTTTASQNETVQTSGFPGDKYGAMYKASGIVDTLTETALHYTFDTSAGQSGSPVYTTGNSLVAAHTYGGNTDNFGTRINSTVLSWVVSETKAAVACFRLYNPNTGEHFFSPNAAEYAQLTNAGWKAEGVAWFAPDQGTAVWRLYNPNAGRHVYTTSAKEAAKLTALGWRHEGTAFQVATAGSPVYRLYNPHDGRHFFTNSNTERNQLIALGWRNEGIAWYGL